MQELISWNLDLFAKEYPGIKYIKLVKTGKEAEVHLLQAGGELMALKIYKQHLKFASQGDYLQLHEIGSGQTMRAVKNKTRKGKQLLAEMWVNREFELLRKMYQNDGNVPDVYMLGENAFLMEYLGDIASPAPRLIDISLTQAEAEQAFDAVLENIWLLLDLVYVHGDLCGSHILWWDEEPIIIDFPQVLSVFHNQISAEKLLHDIEQVNLYFAPHGLQIDSSETERMQQMVVF